MIEHPHHRTPAPPELRLVAPETPTHSDRDAQFRAAVRISPVLAGETAQLLVMTGHGPYLVDATITDVTGHGDGRRYHR
jgi:hypothetical protein